MTVLTRIAFVVLLTGCASAAPTVDDAYVWPVKGQGGDQTAQDKAECYRVAQGFPNGLMPTASAQTHAAYMVGGVTGGAIARELELARQYPPDLAKYGTCLTARGYSVDWPKGKQP